VPTEFVTEAESEGGLGGCCDTIEDEVRLEKRGAGERSVTGRGPHMNLSICQPRGASKSGEKKGGVSDCQNLSLFSPKVLPVPWVTDPTLCARLSAKRRKSLLL
jgi:hypothetical protein